PMTSLATFAALAALTAPADGPEATAEAQGRFDDVVRAYRSLAAYRDAGRFELMSTVGGSTKTVTWPAAVTLARPNRLALGAGAARVVAAGRALAQAIAPSKSYLAGPCPPTIGVPTVAEGPVGAMLLGGPYAPAARLLLALLLDDDPARTILKEVKAIRTE